MKNTYKRIVPIYWKFHYYGNSKWYNPASLCKGFMKQLAGHAALLVYKVRKEDATNVPFYPFDENIVAKVNYLICRYWPTRILSQEDKDTIMSRLDSFLEKLVFGNIVQMIREDHIYKELMESLSKINIDAYLSWLPGDDASKPILTVVTEKRDASNYGFDKDHSFNYGFRSSDISKGHLRLKDSSIKKSLVMALQEFFSYNTYINEDRNSKSKLLYNFKTENDIPYTQIPATEGDFEGLDYNKIIAWWININNTKRLKYSYAKENCCFFIAKALKAGGADKFFTKNKVVWTPYDIADYAKRLRIAINKKALKRSKSTLLKENIQSSDNLLWTKEEFYNQSYVSKMSHRYQKLVKIDKILKKIHACRYIDGVNINSPEQLVHDLIEIKNLIAEIFYERPNTKRYKALYALLLQCNHVLQMIHDQFYDDGDAKYPKQDYFMFMLDPKSSIIDDKINIARKRRMTLESSPI
ncbi:hypothetical protein [Francisella sp. LA112445]|uniref:hypothetical protein n=1 Tax=Francisella sp. LA112445 TaxID=1395624 RepID=UPI001788DA3C|nr:hypothetical protein [Francisella sp. LA112445]